MCRWWVANLFGCKGTAPAYGPKLASIWLSVALSLPESFLGQNLPGHLHLPTFLPQLTVVLHTKQCLIWTFNSVVIRIDSLSSGRRQVSARYEEHFQECLFLLLVHHRFSHKSPGSIRKVTKIIRLHRVGSADSSC